MKQIITITLLFLTLTIQAQIFTPVPIDKYYHIGAGVVLATWGTFMGDNLQLTPEQSALVIDSVVANRCRYKKQ